MPEYYSNTAPDYYHDSDSSEYEFDFSSDAPDCVSDYNSDPSEEKLLSGLAQGLVLTSTPEGRFVYWPDQRPLDLATVRYGYP